MDILLIDDEVSLRRTLRTTLESMGHVAAEASSREQTLALLQKQRFDAAFLDLRLGRESGMDLLPALLQGGAGPRRRRRDRLRHHRVGRRGHAPRRLRLFA